MTNKLTSAVQVIIGSILIGITMSVSAAPLGGYAVLPLIAIVPILFGLYGVQSPVCKLVTGAVSRVKKASDRSLPARNIAAQ